MKDFWIARRNPFSIFVKTCCEIGKYEDAQVNPNNKYWELKEHILYAYNEWRKKEGKPPISSMGKLTGMVKTSGYINTRRKVGTRQEGIYGGFKLKKKVVDSLKKELIDLNKSLNGIKENQKEFLTNFKDNLELISESKDSLKKEVYDFRLLKAQMQKNLLEKFEEELGKELKVNSEKLQTDLKEYNELKEQMSSAVAQVKGLSSEIGKFTEVSKNIKKEDFAAKIEIYKI